MEELLEIGKCISRDDEAVMKEIQECISDIKKYYKEHQSRYEERHILEDYEEEGKEDEDIQWIGLVDCLMEHGYVCELDWKCEKEDFIDCGLKPLFGMQFYNLPLEEEWLDEDAEITEWCAVLDEKWKSKDVCVAALDINSDSYVAFPVSIGEFKKLEELAEEIGYRIALAKDM